MYKEILEKQRILDTKEMNLLEELRTLGKPIKEYGNERED